jgi:hypothetical protein
LFLISGCAAPPRAHAPFQGQPDLTLPGVPQSTGLTAGDYNADGRVDLAMLSGRRGRISLLRNQGGATSPFRPAELISVDVGPSASGMTLDDFNEDGRLDAGHLPPRHR